METGQDLDKAIAVLKEGGLVAIPTETVYGLAANALNEEAVTGIFKAKDRPSFDPLIIHVKDRKAAESYTGAWPEGAIQLAEAFWPGPLTLLLPKKAIISDLVTAGLERVAIRIPRHPLTLSLLSQVDFPLAAPSANPFGYISPTKAKHVADQLGNKVGYILEGDKTEVGIESTIIGWENGDAIIYRMGGLSVEEIEKVIGPVSVKAHSSSNPKAPGMLKSHYAPRKPFYLGDIDELISQHPHESPGILSYSEAYHLMRGKNLILSPFGNLDIAARNLFTYMRELDADESLTCVIAEPVPDEGIGRAINDRLRRAAAK